MSKLLSVLCLMLVASRGLAGEDAPPRVVTATLNEDGIQVAEIIGGSYFFDPAHIVAKVDVPVELRISKEPGIVPHNFVIDAPEAGVQVREEIRKEPKTIRVTFSEPGTYAFYCTKKLLLFKSHRERGMEGTIEIVD